MQLASSSAAHYGAAQYSLSVAYLFILGAITFETVAATLLRFSDGYRKVVPTVGLVASYGIVFVLAAQALTVLPLSIGYPVWAGGCAISTGVVGGLAFGEKKTISKAVGIALVVGGIIVLDTLTKTPVG
jgi:multidrug transporter EmrE-like cation transporter